MKKIFLLLIGTSLFMGCASHTGIVSMGQGNFMVAKQQATGFPGLGNIKAEIISEGVKHCGDTGKEFELVSSQESQPPYVLGNFPRAEIQFRCIAKK